MRRFPHAHATHPQWRMAAAMVIAQLRAQMALPDHAAHPSLGLLYITDHYAGEAQDILECFSAELPEVTDWVGTVGVGVSANNAEYFDEPALAVMLCDLSPDQYRVFSGVAPLAASGRAAGVDGFEAHTALVHADGHTPDLAELITEMADRTTSGYLFGGLVGSRSDSVQFAFSSAGNLQGHGASSGVFHGGLSGVGVGPGGGRTARFGGAAGGAGCLAGRSDRWPGHRGRGGAGAGRRGGAGHDRAQIDCGKLAGAGGIGLSLQVCGQRNRLLALGHRDVLIHLRQRRCRLGKWPPFSRCPNAPRSTKPGGKAR